MIALHRCVHSNGAFLRQARFVKGVFGCSRSQAPLHFLSPLVFARGFCCLCRGRTLLTAIPATQCTGSAGVSAFVLSLVVRPTHPIRLFYALVHSAFGQATGNKKGDYLNR
ncbi:hypothetical protein [Moraxella nonliquefaciens]|uniref:hypothetical protein n=1 Tax=Moraxella nonliquefaciens TaxID=478 RepID=UPI001EF47CD1|nr:hypothetical protein [Moraxella nonliquefaciens]MCG7412269.1 hypothetical protein [Moraxella nonliquefaciens]MDI4498759.1 hypothetical protein [Moraxella nonliquefaciens]MDI4500549.1 hypothetical protein [Moraxella nonliquefaciens]